LSTGNARGRRLSPLRRSNGPWRYHPTRELAVRPRNGDDADLPDRMDTAR